MDIRKYLADIAEATRDIEAYVAGSDLSGYSSSSKTRAAVERKFEIIGEALNRIKRIEPELLSRIRDHGKIIAFRNILAHGYDIVSDPIVWDIIENDVPVLREQVEALLEERA